jgi:Fe-S-cluster containining protein
MHDPPNVRIRSEAGKSSTGECLTCGACCFSDLPTYVRVTGDDHARLGERAEDLTIFSGNRAYMRLVDGHCAALEVEADTGLFRCTVYADRPAICRELARGSGACEGEIATKGERPRLALLRVRAAVTAGR